jgi:hypothetical protein
MTKRFPISDTAEQTLLGAGPLGWIVLAVVYQIGWAIRDLSTPKKGQRTPPRRPPTQPRRTA